MTDPYSAQQPSGWPAQSPGARCAADPARPRPAHHAVPAVMPIPPGQPILTLAACDDELTRLAGQRATALALGDLINVMRLDTRIDAVLDLRNELTADPAKQIDGTAYHHA